VKGEFSARLFKQNQIAEELERELISVTSNKKKTKQLRFSEERQTFRECYKDNKLD
jgi:hypothetical protein